MARRKKEPEPVIQPMNAAPGYSAPAPAPGYGGGYGVPPPGGAEAAYMGGNGTQAAMTAPPPQAPRNPFVNAAFLYTFQRPITATIKGIRPAVGGNSKFGNSDRKGWFLDLLLENNTMATGRINEGDQRHQRLWAKYQGNIVEKRITLRLTNPGDATKAPWTLDCLS